MRIEVGVIMLLKDNDGDDNKSYTDSYGDDDDGYGDEDDRKKATMKTAPTLCQWDAGSPRG